LDLIHERRLGRTGLSVSEVGYGAWGIGGGHVARRADDESLAALNRAIDLGLNFIDTALAYGRGHSEQLVGQVVREREERIVVASKIPPEEPALAGAGRDRPDEAFPADHVRKCTERTSPTSGMDALDVQQFHVWNDEWVGRGTWLRGDRGAQGRGQDPLLRRLDQRPAAGNAVS
jgi:aryl-alcohol dehydrogenase-like predicted oxidoreductase